MMLKQLGIFAILAVCLFTITMSGSNLDADRDNGSVTPETTPEGMVLIPAGQFQMGSEDEDAHDNQQPVHTVHIDAFYMDKYEVTNEEFKAFVDANPQWQKNQIEGKFGGREYLKDWVVGGNDYAASNTPVEFVSWYAAMAYAAWAGKRLPTEAEWEYAARGGLVGKKYPWGDDEPTLADAFYLTDHDHPYKYSGPNLVGQYAPNGYGLYDMAGNVWEWCLDPYDPNFNFYAVSDNSRNPIAGGKTVQWLCENFTTMTHTNGHWFHGVLRGGSWSDPARSLRVAYRLWQAPRDVSWGFGLGVRSGFGFRCVRDVTP